MKKAQIEKDEKIEKLKIWFAKIGQIKIDQKKFENEGKKYLQILDKLKLTKKLDKVEKVERFDFNRQNWKIKKYWKRWKINPDKILRFKNHFNFRAKTYLHIKYAFYRLLQAKLAGQ